MGAHTLLRQRSDLRARYYFSQSQHFGELRSGPRLSGRVVPYRWEAVDISLGGALPRMVILWISRCTRSVEFIDLNV
jgi:hypothetical protein